MLLEPVQLVVVPGGSPGLVRAEELGEAAALLRTERVHQPDGDLDQGEPGEDPASILGSQGIHQALQGDHSRTFHEVILCCNIPHLVG